MEPAVKALRELGDLAHQSSLRVSVYHHVNDWTEGLPFTLEVVRKVNHPNVGANFNLCHWLKIEGAKDYAPLLRAHGDKIFAVTLCGAQRDAQTWTNGLIQPLDRGDFDNPRLLATLREAGYRGPIGLMCYGIPDEAGVHLARSMKMWKLWLRGEGK
jgi:sugar phosphate isomerase/epimerase